MINIKQIERVLGSLSDILHGVWNLENTLLFFQEN